jgi:F0F1-type ATP synthase assembly protein I
VAGRNEDRGVPEGLSGLARARFAAEPYLRAASSLLGGVALGVVAGYFADARLGTKPWLLVAGSVAGMGIGFYAFVKALQEAEKRKRG